MNNDIDTERDSVSRTDTPPADLAGRLGSGPPLPPDGRRWRAFALLVATNFITIVDFTIVNVALPTIGRALRFPESGLQWLVTAYGLTFAGFLLLGGRAADLLDGAGCYGRPGRLHRRLAGRGAGHRGRLPHRDARAAGARGRPGAAGRAVDRDEHVRRGRRAQQGPRHLGRGWRARRDGRLLAGGISPATSDGGTSSSSTSDWHGGAGLDAPNGAESRVRSGPRRYDSFGAVSVTAALLMLVYAISQAPQAGWTAPRTVAMLVAGAALFVLFIVIESRVEAPLLPLRLFRLAAWPGPTRWASCSGRAS